MLPWSWALRSHEGRSREVPSLSVVLCRSGAWTDHETVDTRAVRVWGCEAVCAVLRAQGVLWTHLVALLIPNGTVLMEGFGHLNRHCSPSYMCCAVLCCGVSPPPPVSDECFVQRTLPVGPYFWDPINSGPGSEPRFQAKGLG